MARIDETVRAEAHPSITYARLSKAATETDAQSIEPFAIFLYIRRQLELFEKYTIYNIFLNNRR